MLKLTVSLIERAEVKAGLIEPIVLKESIIDHQIKDTSGITA